MPYAVEFYFDASSETKIKEIWRDMAVQTDGLGASIIGIDYRPHISLAVYDSEGLDLKLMKKQIIAFAKPLESFRLELSFIGCFANEGVIFLGPKVTKNLLKTHARFHKELKTHSNHLQPYYNTDNWIPHCTIAYGLSNDGLSTALINRSVIDLPLTIQAQAIGIVHVTSEKAKEVFNIKFQV